MEFGRAFSYQFNDPDWIKKIALVALINLIPIVGVLFTLGWGLEITRRVIRREPELLPEIDFGAYLGKGFKVFLAGLVYSIPLIIFYVPVTVFPALVGSSSSDSSNALMTISTIVSLCCGGLMLIYSIALAIFFPAALGLLADRDTVGAALKFGDVIALVRSAPTAYLLVAVGSIAASIVSSLGTIACVIGVIFTTAYAGSIVAHLTGQAYREANHI